MSFANSTVLEMLCKFQKIPYYFMIQAIKLVNFSKEHGLNI